VSGDRRIDSEELVISDYNPTGLLIGVFRKKIKKMVESEPN